MAGYDPAPLVAAAPLRTTDDNPGDSCTPKNAHDCPNFFLSCLVTHPAWSWQVGLSARPREVGPDLVLIKLARSNHATFSAPWGPPPGLLWDHIGRDQPLGRSCPAVKWVAGFNFALHKVRVASHRALSERDERDQTRL
jgi:hypothetical protein